jgi:hypothetical protein
MIRRVCFLVLLAASPAAFAQTVQVSISPTQDLSHVELGTFLDGSSLGFGTVFDLENLPDIAGGTTYSATVTLQESVVFPVLAYTVIGVYTNGSIQGATIGFSSLAGSALINASAPWPFSPNIDETAFISDPYLAYFNDSDQADLLMDLMLRSSALDPALPSDTGQLVNFSNGTNGGTMLLNPVPEPPTLFCLGFGLLILLRRRALKSCQIGG